MKAPSQDFAQEGAYLGLTQVTLCQKSKIPQIWPTIFDEPCNCIFPIYFISVFPLGGGTFHPLGCVPAAGRFKYGKIHYGMIPALFTILTMDPENNADVV